MQLSTRRVIDFQIANWYEDELKKNNKKNALTENMKPYILCLPLLTAKIQHQYIKQ